MRARVGLLDDEEHGAVVVALREGRQVRLARDLRARGGRALLLEEEDGGRGRGGAHLRRAEGVLPEDVLLPRLGRARGEGVEVRRWDVLLRARGGRGSLTGAAGRRRRRQRARAPGWSA